MCTVTVVPFAGGLRMVHNRDESRLRAAGLPPRVERFAAGAAILPRDATAGGTWIAVTDRGWVAALLNVYQAPRTTPPPGRPSRGLIIPRLLDCGSASEAYGLAREFAAGDFGPHRLIIADAKSVVSLTCDNRVSTVRRAALTRPMMFTSSGLGDALVGAPRRRLFRQMFAETGDWAAQQDAFHTHRWPDRPEKSVWMCRSDARTVSRTTAEVTPGQVSMVYTGLADDDSRASPAACSLATPSTTSASNIELAIPRRE